MTSSLLATIEKARPACASPTPMVAIVGVVYVVAYAASFVEIESVIASGVVLSLFGLLASRASFRCGAGAGVVVGALAVVLSLSLFVAVHAYDWSPHDAKDPFAAIGGVALAAFFIGIAKAGRQLLALATPPSMTPISTSTLLSVPERPCSSVEARD